MKYFNPSYWFKLWVLSAPLFNDKTQGINAKSIDNKKIKNWVNNNTNLESINQEMINPNSNITNQPYNLSQTNQNINPFYQSYLDSISNQELEISTHKHRHEKSRNRIKKQHNRHSKEILKLNQTLIIDKNTPSEYITSSRRILQSLEIERILEVAVNFGREGDDSIIFTLNTENYGYFRLPVEIRWEQDGHSIQRNLELVFRTDNLYLQGFIIPRYIPHIGETYDYYHFNFNLVRPQYIPRPPRVPNLTRIQGTNSIILSEISPDYRDLLPRENNHISWENICNSFIRLTNEIVANQEESLGNLAQSLGHVIFVTAEALRFRNIYNIINNDIINNNHAVSVLFRNNEIYSILVRWGTESRSYSNLLFGSDGRYHGFEHTYGIDYLIHIHIIGNSQFNFIDNLVPIDAITEYLRNANVRILLSHSTLRLTFDRITSNCNKRSIEFKISFYWKEKFCDIKSQVNQIQGEIKTIKIINNNIKDENLHVDDIFVETTEGFYLIHENGKVGKFFPEKTLHWRDDKSLFKLWNSWWDWKENFWTKNFKMGWINPKKYNRIEFLGDTSNSRISWGETDYYADKFDELEKADLSRYIKDNEGICDKDNYQNLKTWFDVQKLNEWWKSARIEGKQSFGFCSYKENDDYYLKIVIVQAATCHASSIGGALFLELGRGVRLYNDDITNFAEMNFNIKNIENSTESTTEETTTDITTNSVTEFTIEKITKNSTTWTDDFTKSINNEQHLSIDNKPNFVTNNITSL